MNPRRRKLMQGLLVGSMLGGCMKNTPVAASFARTREVRCGALTFPVLIWGPDEARPVLLLHGFPQEPATWAPIAQALAREGFQAIAPWQRGYIASARPPQPNAYSFTAFIGDVLGIADALDIKQFDVTGFGVGAAVAWMLAGYRGDRVRSITAIRYPHPAAFARAMQSDTEQRQKWLQLQQELGAGGPSEQAVALLAEDAAGLKRFLLSSGLPQPFIDLYVARLKEPGALAAALSWNAAISLEELAWVPAVTVPALLMWSEGPALARTTAEATGEYVRSRFTRICIADGSHFLLESAPTALIRPLLQHLQSS
jgi:pimeloyl-ACP methyl ester carboxylesterase